MARISLKNVKKSYGTTHVIKGVDIEIDDGEFCVFVGPSGCGKSTLLRMIAGLEDISSGDAADRRDGGERPAPRERGVAMVFQSYAIFPHMTVRENVAFGLTISGASKAEKDAKVAEAARILQMEHLLDRRPSQLVRRPAPARRHRPRHRAQAAGVPVRRTAVEPRRRPADGHADGDRQAAPAAWGDDDLRDPRPGRGDDAGRQDRRAEGRQVMQIGAPMDLYHDPANLFVAGFLGAPSMNFLKVKVQGVNGGKVLVSNAALDPVEVSGKRAAFKVGDEAILGLRPQYLTVAQGRGAARHGGADRTAGGRDGGRGDAARTATR
jgi:multiple sugar transport system ATP-binding protein